MATHDENLNLKDIEFITFDQMKEITIKSTDLEKPINPKVIQEIKPKRKEMAYNKDTFDLLGIKTIRGL